MGRQHERDVGELLGQPGDRALAVRAIGSPQDSRRWLVTSTARRPSSTSRAGFSSGQPASDDVEQRVDDGVAGDHDVAPAAMPSASRLAREVAVGREVQRGELRGQPPVDLLGERVVAVAGAQPGLDVDDGHLLVEGGQPGHERRGGVALDHQRVRTLLRG